jgi:hypothetical protein
MWPSCGPPIRIGNPKAVYFGNAQKRCSLTKFSSFSSIAAVWGYHERAGAYRLCVVALLDHIIAMNEQHLKRLLSQYVCYYHEDRTHLGLGKGTPNGRSRDLAPGRRPRS